MAENLLVLLLGSNLGDRSGNLKRARMQIAENIGPIDSVSSVYETAPWGYDSINGFLNQCLSLWSNKDPVKLLSQTQMIESEMGRKARGGEYTDRLIDIDILFYGNMILSRPDLQIPHDMIPHRRFTLVPLAEILPEFEHPVLGKKICTMLSECVDNLEVKRMKGF
jgi:2-amino-4-hydroxy-6-hydroxymethyldihydropteridine diphosphokinase